MNFTLRNLADTARLGRALAAALGEQGSSQVMLLAGDLGAGKTTLTRFLVEALPGGNEAEVSSPSFTLCNVYPTRPEIAHYDFYRLEDREPPEDYVGTLYSIEEKLFEKTWGLPVVMIVEWPERLASNLLPDEYIHCRLTAEQNDRRASFTGYGKAARKTLERLQTLF